MITEPAGGSPYDIPGRRDAYSVISIFPRNLVNKTATASNEEECKSLRSKCFHRLSRRKPELIQGLKSENLPRNLSNHMNVLKTLAPHFRNFQIWLEWTGTRELIFPVTNEHYCKRHGASATTDPNREIPAVRVEILEHMKELEYDIQGLNSQKKDEDPDAPPVAGPSNSPPYDPYLDFTYECFEYDIYDIRTDPSIDISGMLDGSTTVMIPRGQNGHPTRQILGAHEDMCKIAMEIKAEEATNEEVIGIAQEESMASLASEQRGDENSKKKRIMKLIRRVFGKRSKKDDDHTDDNKNVRPMPGLPT
ncbi:hypothetical protein TWF506_009315 [Arthrobotrys conoides]|uniref:Uncharacterized protein n=1 Tax=Arthrobotrys conoides TaxID=74498 RepID=A0AAN8RWZ3_9PEZI